MTFPSPSSNHPHTLYYSCFLLWKRTVFWRRERAAWDIIFRWWSNLTVSSFGHRTVFKIERAKGSLTLDSCNYSLRLRFIIEVHLKPSSAACWKLLAVVLNETFYEFYRAWQEHRYHHLARTTSSPITWKSIWLISKPDYMSYYFTNMLTNNFVFFPILAYFSSIFLKHSM